MKENKYDDPDFFERYGSMQRSVHGLAAAGEWHVLRQMLPDLQGKMVLDLGCGYGWHCRYMREQGAAKVIGVDISEKMLERARQATDDVGIEYRRMAIEDIEFEVESFDVVFSSLALHYVKDYGELCKKVYGFLKPGGVFVFSAEHPIVTALEAQDWYRDGEGNPLHWPVDNYQDESIRHTDFLGHKVAKYHRTVATWMNGLIEAGFVIKRVAEPVPDEEMLRKYPDMKDEGRRPIFLLVKAEKG